MKCSATRRTIDQADDPASLPFETAAHVERCSSCSQFASERKQLRKLLMEPHRVSAPANFEGMVARRLAERGAGRPFWLAIGFYLRAAGAAAALACLVIVIQTVRLKPVSSPALPPSNVAINPAPGIEEAPSAKENTSAGNLRSEASLTTVGTVKGGHHMPIRKQRVVLDAVNTEWTLAATDMTAQPRALILVRNSGSEQEIAVPMVSVGAMPWVPVSVSQDERGRIAF
jgi:hypothetical protein